MQARLDAVIAEQHDRSGSPVRDRDLAEQLKTMPDGELRATRRDMQAGLGLMRPESPMYAPARAYMDAVTAELTRRTGHAARRPARLPAFLIPGRQARGLRKMPRHPRMPGHQWSRPALARPPGPGPHRWSLPALSHRE